MTRHSFLSDLNRMSREFDRAVAARERERVRQAAALERQRKYLERQERMEAKEAARLHVEMQTAEALRLTEEIGDRIPGS